ncbi:helix-turn-helix transcriptional regulator [Haloferax sulfurifontis]|uniref:DNA primase catalytic core domain-containing protein n=2 Tax=Haloferax sulfurifontis TaxID=255616 RepID=M0IMA1_9EURY|nr:sigma factor-like helix-turn-helix DNA-binding protein [Haloferax sulfurifontis]ELZ96574.1 DNA primase catalytic core domain-containing protein [Haloferax sulfurifontis ATCC BAA-897]GGC72735.1 hypothetical protein GCM10007209_38400 [Haloferax sulfurifontis]
MQSDKSRPTGPERIDKYEEHGLSGKQARVVVEKERGRTDEEVADALGMKVGTVKSHLARARAKYRDAQALVSLFEEKYDPEEVSRILLSGGEFVTPHGTLTASGWDTMPSTVFAESDANRDVVDRWALAPEDEPTGPLPDLTDLLDAQVDDRMLPVLAWFYAAPFASVIRKLGGGFPALNVYGGPESGKTETLAALTQMFGWDGTPFPASNTTARLTFAFSSSESAPVWFDNYSGECERLHKYLRLGYRGGTEARGNADGTVTEYQLLAPVVVSGQSALTDRACETRAISTEFVPASTRDEDCADAFASVRDADLQRHALTFYQYALTLSASELLDVWEHSRPPRDVREQGALTPEEATIVETVNFGLNIAERFSERADTGGFEVDEATKRQARTAAGVTFESS